MGLLPESLFREGRLVLAPVAGYTDSPFRRICRRNGAALVFTELISAEGVVRGNKKTLKLADFYPEERPLGIQLFGKDPLVLAEAACIVSELKPDLIDINMGCPMQRICGSGSGSALLKKPELAYDIVKAVVNSVTLPVSAKIRIGWDSRSLNYREMVEALEQGGISLVSVHGRTRAQGYSGQANWDIISDIAAFANVPVIGNGDIRSREEAFKRLGQSGCAAVMIGRAAFGNPWIFSGRIPDHDEFVSVIFEHMKLMQEEYGDYGSILMRKHLARYVHGFKNAAKIRHSLMRTGSFEEIRNVLLNTPDGDEIS